MQNDENPKQEINQPVSVSEQQANTTQEQTVSSKLSPSRTAIIIAAVIVFTRVFLSLMSLFLYARTQPSEIARTIAYGFGFLVAGGIDVFLAINLLLNNGWTRTWMLIRLVGGIILGIIVSLIQRNFGDLIQNTALHISLLLLLTGNSSRSRIVVGVLLAIYGIIGGAVLEAILALTK